MRNRKTQWLAAAIIILVVGAVVGSVLLSGQRSGSDVMDISLPDPSASASFENSTWPVEKEEKQQSVKLTCDNVRTVIEMMERPKEYFFRSIATVFYGDSERRVSASQWVLDNRTVTCRTDEKLKTKTFLIRRNGFVTMWPEGGSEAYTCAEGQFDNDDLAGIPTYEEILTSDDTIIQTEYRLYGEELCIFLRTRSGSDSSDYYVGISSGLLLHCDTYADNELIYSMSLTDWSEDVSEADSIIPPE